MQSSIVSLDHIDVSDVRIKLGRKHLHIRLHLGGGGKGKPKKL